MSEASDSTLWLYTIDWSATGAMLAAFAAIGAAFGANYWAAKDNKAASNMRMAELRMQSVEKLSTLSSELVGLLTSHAMLSENDLHNVDEMRHQVKEVEVLKFKILHMLEQYPSSITNDNEGPDPIGNMRTFLQKLTEAKTPEEIRSNAREFLKLSSALVSVETDGVSELIVSRGQS